MSVDLQTLSIFPLGSFQMKPPLEFLIYQQIKNPIFLNQYTFLKNALKGLPTKPSTFLSKTFKKFFPKQSYEQTNTPFYSNNKPFWDLTILGDPDNKDNNQQKSSLTLCYLTILENMLL